MGRYTSGGVGRDILAGAAAGIAAIWVANKLDQHMRESAGPQAMRDTEAARPGGMDPAHVLAKKAADAVGLDVASPKDNAAGHTIHYGIAASMGALYGLVRGMAPAITSGRGAIFGIALFVLKDEIGNTAMGTAGNPLNYPARDHARGAAVNAVFGVVTDLAVRLLSPWRDEVVVLQGPPLSERVEQGRQYLTQARDQAYRQGRAYLDQGIGTARQFADEARTRFPRDEVADLARRGQEYAGRARNEARTQWRDVQPTIQRGRREAERLVAQASAYVPEIPRSGLSRALDRLFA